METGSGGSLKKTALVFVYILSTLLFFFSCKGIDNKSSSFSYTLTENNCTTGEKTFSTNEAMCNALRDDALNQYCAQSLRFQKFQNECPGMTW